VWHGRRRYLLKTRRLSRLSRDHDDGVAATRFHRDAIAATARSLSDAPRRKIEKETTRDLV
jgi:hypothetical protein